MIMFFFRSYQCLTSLLLSSCWLLKPKERVTELESTVQGLQSQLEQQEQDAQSVIDQWQEAFSTSDARCSELEKELENLKNNGVENSKVGGVEEAHSHDLSPGLQPQSANDFFSSGEPDSGNDRINALEGQLKETEAALREAREILSRDEDVVQQWEGMYNIAFGGSFLLLVLFGL